MRGLVQLMPSRHLLAAMAIIVFVLGFNGLSLAQSVDLSTPEKTIDAMGTYGGAGSGSACCAPPVSGASSAMASWARS